MHVSSLIAITPMRFVRLQAVAAAVRVSCQDMLPLMVILLAACANVPSQSERHLDADALASARGWQSSVIPAGPFNLLAYGPLRFAPDDSLTIYIEGDGFAWVTASQPSTDPTPRDPVGLRLALAQPTGNVVYLGRPCQYGGAGQPECAPKYWTGARFSVEVIEASSAAVDVLKARAGAQRLVLVGYSGGGAVAALLAARRTDIASLVTVAGNLDHRAWTSFHHVDPLTAESLNASDVADQLATLPQTHFVGERDEVIPPELAQRLPVGLRGKNGRNIRVISGFDHHCCWADMWPALWHETQSAQY